MFSKRVDCRTTSLPAWANEPDFIEPGKCSDRYGHSSSSARAMRRRGAITVRFEVSDVAEGPSRFNIPESTDSTLYHVVASRRLGYDQMMWQTPALSLTAQAFLFTIALDSASSRVARIVSMVLAMAAAGASIQLMAKHRRMEEHDSKWLEAYEDRHSGCVPPHGQKRQDFSAGFLRWLSDQSSFKLWLKLLACFLFAAVLTLILAVIRPDWLVSVGVE